MKKIEGLTEQETESLQMDSDKMIESFKRLYGLDNVVILARKGDSLGTFFGSDDDIVASTIIAVAHKFHNEGVKKF